MDKGELKADEPIPVKVTLWRRIRPHDHCIDQTGRHRPQSWAFADHKNGSAMSVFVAELVTEDGRTSNDIMDGFDGWGLVEISSTDVQELAQQVVYKPLPDEPAHAEVVGEKKSRVTKKLARTCKWVVTPSSPPKIL